MSLISVTGTRHTTRLTGTPARRAAHAASVARRRIAHVDRRFVQVALGLIWLLDGALQLQPFMFTKGFARHVIAPAAAGQPHVVASPVLWAAALIVTHPAIYDALFAGAQLTIGAGLLFRSTVRPALLASIGWAAGVWIFGEGIGGLGSGATFLIGAPGAALLYALLAFAAWPAMEGVGHDIASLLSKPSPQALRQRLAGWTPYAWAAIWLLFAGLSALPVNASVNAVKSQFASGAAGAPAWIASLDRAVESGVGAAGMGAVIGIVVLEAMIGVLAIRPGRGRAAAVWTGICLAAFFWISGQSLGQIPTGKGTDPSSAPLVALLGLAVLGAASVTGRIGAGRQRSVHSRRGSAQPLCAQPQCAQPQCAQPGCAQL